ncbi:MAG: inositol monophosphatase family protein [Alphaproteobacteria bacterium]
MARTASDELQRAVALTREAGAIAMRHFRRAHAAWEKAPGDLVTEADLAIDRFLRARLPQGDADWLSEETTDAGHRLGAPRVWIVDPIDGTRSYANGKAEFAVSVALWDRGRVTVGVVLNPATDELFTVVEGEPARRNGTPMRVRGWRPGGGVTLLVSGREARTAGFETSFAHAKVRGLGSLAYRLARVAAGQADGLVSLRRVADWDLAAGVAMVEAAGGIVTDRHGAPLDLNRPQPHHDGLVVAAPELHGVLLDHLAHLS